MKRLSKAKRLETQIPIGKRRRYIPNGRDGYYLRRWRCGQLSYFCLDGFPWEVPAAFSLPNFTSSLVCFLNSSSGRLLRA